MVHFQVDDYKMVAAVILEHRAGLVCAVEHAGVGVYSDAVPLINVEIEKLGVLGRKRSQNTQFFDLSLLVRGRIQAWLVCKARFRRADWIIINSPIFSAVKSPTSLSSCITGKM